MSPQRCPTTSCACPKASRRPPECSPSAPTTMSNRRTVPLANVTLTPFPSSVSSVIQSSNRYSVPSRVASYRLVDSDMELDLDQLFEFGLGRLLLGLEQPLAGR